MGKIAENAEHDSVMLGGLCLGLGQLWVAGIGFPGTWMLIASGCWTILFGTFASTCLWRAEMIPDGPSEEMPVKPNASS